MPSRNERLRRTLHNKTKNKTKKDRKAAAKRKLKIYSQLKVFFERHQHGEWRKIIHGGCRKKQNWIVTGSNWIAASLCQLLRLQIDQPHIRSNVLEALAILLDRPLFWSFVDFILEREEKGADGTNLILDVLEKEVTWRDRERAFALLNKLIREPTLECGERAVRIVLRAVASHCNEGPRSTRELLEASLIISNVLFYLPDRRNRPRNGQIPWITQPITEMIFDDAYIMRFLFDMATRTVDEKIRNLFASVLTFIWRRPMDADRTTIIVRYWPLMKQALLVMPTKVSVNPLWIKQYAAIVATDPLLLDRLSRQCQVVCAKEKEEQHIVYRYACDIGVIVIESALESPKTLQEVLGSGLLTATARWFSSIEYDQRIFNLDQPARRIAIYRRVLDLHPEWRGTFKSVTSLSGGRIGNVTADLGRELDERPERDAKDYILYEEDSQI